MTVTVLGPPCPDCGRKGSLTRVPMRRAYVRDELANGRRWIPIGWYCRFCGQLSRLEAEWADALNG